MIGCRTLIRRGSGYRKMWLMNSITKPNETMGNRMTDTGKWDKPWFRKLEPKLKALWIYLTDRCDPAGVWDGDFEAASYYIGEEVTEKDLKQFGDRVQKLGDSKFWLTKFIDFQCVTLSRNTPAHNPVFRSIEKHKLPYKVPSELVQDEQAIFDEIIRNAEFGDNAMQMLKSDMTFLRDCWGQCFKWHCEKPNPPRAVWQWRQKLITWMQIELRKKQTYVKGNRQQQHTKGLAEGFLKRHGSPPASGADENNQ